MARWQSAILLHPSTAGCRLWQLSASGDRFSVQSEKSMLSTDPLPANLVTKDWKTLFRGKLNIAWMPADKVFLRAIQLPSGEPAEIAQMVELQMEKISPVPVTQAVWSIYLMPRPENKPDALQTVIVIIAARNVAEEYLGHLESQGFLADRLEAPVLDQLLAVNIHDEGVWIIPGNLGEPALVAWWYGGTMQNISLVGLSSATERGQQLRTQIEQMAWAGELEGWLPGTPKIHLVASPQEASFWESVFKEAGESIDVVAPLPEAQLAARSAERCVKESSTSLLPPEFAKRYRQQFVDGLWMRGAFALLSLYVVGVLIYFGALYALRMKYDHVHQELVGLGNAYTNALADQAQLRILQERDELKYAVLDCWKAVSENLPEGVTIDSMYFDHHKLELKGTASADEDEAVQRFNEDLRHVANPKRPEQTLFSEVSPPKGNITGASEIWSFTAQLKDTGSE